MVYIMTTEATPLVAIQRVRNIVFLSGMDTISVLRHDVLKVIESTFRDLKVDYKISKREESAYTTITTTGEYHLKSDGDSFIIVLKGQNSCEAISSDEYWKRVED